jgi:hypothetical protein
MRIAICLILFLAAVCSGCRSVTTETDKLMASFDGRHVSNALAVLGPPTQVLDDGKGGQIFSWTDVLVYIPSPPSTEPAPPCAPNLDPLGYAMGRGFARGFEQAGAQQGPRRIISAKVLTVNPNGIVYDWSWRQGDWHGSRAEYMTK